jgi:hypothetical protein
MEIKKITFTNFEIAYDGMFELIAEGKRHLIYLTPAMLLSLFETEGYTLKDAPHKENEYFKLPFVKSSISLIQCLTNGKPDGYRTSDFAEHYQDKRLILLDVEVG